MDTLSNKLVFLVTQQYLPAAENYEILKSYLNILKEKDSLAGVLTVEPGLQVLEKEMLMYQNLLILSASFISFFEDTAMHYTQEELVDKALKEVMFH